MKYVNYLALKPGHLKITIIDNVPLKDKAIATKTVKQAAFGKKIKPSAMVQEIIW